MPGTELSFGLTPYIIRLGGDSASQLAELIRRIRSLDKNLRFEELRKILEYYGYHMSGLASGSSHKTFRKPGCSPNIIPMHDPIKRAYVELVKDVVESEENDDESN